MEPFDKLNETFNVEENARWTLWPILKFILILFWSIWAMWNFADGIQYLNDHGIKPSIQRLWEGPK